MLRHAPNRLAPHSSWAYSAPVNTGLQQQALAATTPNAAGYRVTMSLEKSLRLFDLSPAFCQTNTLPSDTFPPQHQPRSRPPVADPRRAVPDHITSATIREWHFALYFASLRFTINRNVVRYPKK